MEQIIKITILLALITAVIKLILPKKENEINGIKIRYKTEEEIQEEIYRKEKIKQKLEKDREEKIKSYKMKKEQPININETIEPIKTKKEIFEENRKERYKKHLKDIATKGKDYEIFVGEYYKELGYKITQNGIIKGKKDDSIDVIAKKENEIIFIQCKNWKIDKKKMIDHKDIKSFVGNIYTFVEKNPVYKNYNIKRKFIASNDIFNRSAKRYCRENRNIVEYKILPMT